MSLTGITGPQAGRCMMDDEYRGLRRCMSEHISYTRPRDVPNDICLWIQQWRWDFALRCRVFNHLGRYRY